MGGSLLLRAMKRPSAEALVTRMSSIPRVRDQDRVTGHRWVRRNQRLEPSGYDKRRSRRQETIKPSSRRQETYQTGTRRQAVRCAFQESDRHDTFANRKRTHTNNSAGSSEPEFVALPQADTGRLESCGGPVRFGGDCEIGGDWKRLSEIRGRD